jgi:multiple sugar transport system substrate-binding protein
MKRGLVSVLALGAAAALALSACSSSKDKGGGSNGTTTLKFVGADYGTGPANSSQKYWQDIADAFHAQNPKITVKVQTINWNDFDNQVQTMVQNHQFRGRLLLQLRAGRPAVQGQRRHDERQQPDAGVRQAR